MAGERFLHHLAVLEGETFAGTALTWLLDVFKEIEPISVQIRRRGNAQFTSLCTRG